MAKRKSEQNHPAVKKRKRKSRAGRKGYKVAISVRLDKGVMDLAYSHIKRYHVRITDFLERGVILALNEWEKMPQVSQRSRLLIQGADEEQQHVVQQVLALLKVAPEEISPLESAMREYFLDFLARFEQSEPKAYSEALARYPVMPPPARAKNG